MKNSFENEMGQHSMLNDGFMKGFSGFGNMGFPEFKMPKMPSFRDFDMGFGDFEKNMRHHMADIPKMMGRGMKMDPNGSSESESFSSSSSSNMG